jgi:hypothetical protein
VSNTPLNDTLKNIRFADAEPRFSTKNLETVTLHIKIQNLPIKIFNFIEKTVKVELLNNNKMSNLHYRLIHGCMFKLCTPNSAQWCFKGALACIFFLHSQTQILVNFKLQVDLSFIKIQRIIYPRKSS